MQDDKKGAKIKITENGPYVVTGNVPLGEKIIMPKGDGVQFVEGQQFPREEQYALCRCGKSKNAPYCDGSHADAKFNGAETASKKKYADRAMLQTGAAVDLYDDGRCAFARFCHTENGVSTWNLLDASDHKAVRDEVVRTAGNCPSGRLTAAEKTGETIEPRLEPAIDIIQDPYYGASSGIYVKGGIPLESADGAVYETRNRYMLCRCGKSRNKPFCDATHVSVGYSDHKKDE